MYIPKYERSGSSSRGCVDAVYEAWPVRSVSPDSKAYCESCDTTRTRHRQTLPRGRLCEGFTLSTEG